MGNIFQKQRGVGCSVHFTRIYQENIVMNGFKKSTNRNNLAPKYSYFSSPASDTVQKFHPPSIFSVMGHTTLYCRFRK